MSDTPASAGDPRAGAPDPHAPEHHGLGPVKGGRPLLPAVAAVALVAVVAAGRACRGRGGRGAQAPAPAEGQVSIGEAAQKQAGLSTAAVRRLTRSDRVEAPGTNASRQKKPCAKAKSSTACLFKMQTASSCAWTETAW